MNRPIVKSSIYNRIRKLSRLGLALFGGVLIVATPLTASANEQVVKGMPAGTVLVQDASPNKIVIGNLSSFATTAYPSAATMHSGDTVKGGKTTVLNGSGDRDSSMFVVNTGPNGQIGTTSSNTPSYGSNMDAVVDRYFTLPASSISMLSIPQTNFSTAGYTSKTVTRIKYTSDKANKAAIVRLEVGKSSKSKAFYVYPCDKSFTGRIALYSSTSAVKTTTLFVDTGSTAEVCVRGETNSTNVSAETFGFGNWKMENPVQLSTMISEGRKAAANGTITIQTNTPNQIALLQITAVSAKKGTVEVYPTSLGSKSLKSLYTNESRESNMIAVYTGVDGNISLKSNVSTGYNVTLMGSIDSAEAGANVAKAYMPRTLEDTRDGYPGQGLVLISSKRNYVKPYQIFDIKCETRFVFGPTDAQKRITFKVRGLDPESPENYDEAYDQGFAKTYINDFGTPGGLNTFDWMDRALANSKGVASSELIVNNTDFTGSIYKFNGIIVVDNLKSFFYRYNQTIDGSARYQLSLNCVKK